MDRAANVVKSCAELVIDGDPAIAINHGQSCPSGFETEFMGDPH
jgi:hypothetical protein